MIFCLVQMKLLSKDFGKHLLEVEDLLHKHALQEADITIQADRVQTLNDAALKFTTIDGTFVLRVLVTLIRGIITTVAYLTSKT